MFDDFNYKQNIIVSKEFLMSCVFYNKDLKDVYDIIEKQTRYVCKYTNDPSIFTYYYISMKLHEISDNSVIVITLVSDNDNILCNLIEDELTYKINKDIIF